jgi:predicted PolB exonuclease-like 3'-5' exonuclease
MTFTSSKEMERSETAVVYDIETIPQKGLSKIQESELQIRFERSKMYERTLKGIGEMSVAAAKRKFMAISPYFGQIICIGLYWPCSKKKEALVGTEHQILTNFWDRIRQENFTGYFISFNGLSFDAPFIMRRSMILNILPTNQVFMDTYRYQKKPHRDVYLMISDFGTSFLANLDLACDAYGIESPKHGAVRADNVAEYYEKGEIQLIADYCLRDVMATNDLHAKAMKYIHY